MSSDVPDQRAVIIWISPAKAGLTQQILVIDGSKQIHSLISGLLSNERATIHFASDGGYGLPLAESIHPDLILLDVEMPGIDGHETFRRLKADPNLCNIPVVFLTALNMAEENVRGLEQGFSPPLPLR